ncbi:hypothetical protein VTI28DRAFT_1360 [Corynascus sepedonium]
MPFWRAYTVLESILPGRTETYSNLGNLTIRRQHYDQDPLVDFPLLSDTGLGAVHPAVRKQPTCVNANNGTRLTHHRSRPMWPSDITRRRGSWLQPKLLRMTATMMTTDGASRGM